MISLALLSADSNITDLLQRQIAMLCFAADGMDLSSCTFLWWAPKDVRVMQQSA